MSLGKAAANNAGEFAERPATQIMALKRTAPHAVALSVPVRSALIRSALILAGFCALALPLLHGQGSVPTHSTGVSAHKFSRHKRKPVKPAPAPVEAAPVTAQEPPKPNWPVNDPSQPGHVGWDGSRLTITATNASLSQVLREVSSATGLKVEGLDNGRDQRIFGVFGPAPVRDVLNQVLDGSGYNVIILGDRGAGNPRELLLAAQTPGSKNAGNHPQSDFNQPAEEEPEPEPEPEPQPEPQRPQQGPPPPGARPAQQYLQDLRNQQQQQQQQPAANPGQNPTQGPPNE